MISKEERKRDRAICEAATVDWQQGNHVGEPKALCSAATPDESLLMLDKDGMAIFWREPDARAAVTARNRLPAYIAALDGIEKRFAAAEEVIAATARTATICKEHGDLAAAAAWSERAKAMAEILEILRCAQ